MIVTDLNPGITYNLVVRARNIIGYSNYSQSVAVLAAQVPDSPVLLENDALNTKAY